jgi:hypothetical protein
MPPSRGRSHQAADEHLRNSWNGAIRFSVAVIAFRSSRAVPSNRAASSSRVHGFHSGAAIPSSFRLPQGRIRIELGEAG